ncbi:MAG: carboxypeptidase-like regulatory domain-containing protein [Bacteroidetes bacterium]|nr:carboxypeptidase-like regulatory domain-containing protein [Bacteroidota bacterium]
MTILVVIFWLFSSPSLLWAQKITGQIQDSKTSEALPFANVFVNNSTMGTVTNANGEFELTIQEPGVYEVVFSYVGYESYRRKVTVGDQPLSIGIIKLVPDEVQLNSVEVVSKRDKVWEKNLKKFKKVFFGEGKQGNSCAISNPWVLEFSTGSSGEFIAKASAPIEFTNEALGYKVVFYLKNFWSSNDSYVIAGDTRFTPITSQNPKDVAKWELNRTSAYLHSAHHLFKSIVNRQMKGEGFALYSQIISADNPNVRSAIFHSEIGKKVAVYDTTGIVQPDVQKGYYRISLKGHLEIHYSKIRSEVPFYSDFTGPVSWLDVRNGFLIVNSEGYPKNPSDLVISGAMSANRVAQMLPLDYVPGKDESKEQSIQLSFYQEQMYIHTDKPYYYPGETIWCRGYINYNQPAWRDSLSRTVYVELINRVQQRLLLSKTVRIDSGFFSTEFVIPDTLPAATYHLRAYTQLNRQFGDKKLYIKPIPVLDLKERVISNLPTTPQTPQNNYDVVVSISSSKAIYQPREKVTLNLLVKDDEEQPMASVLSMSVTDTKQVTPINYLNTILTDFPMRQIDVADAKKSPIIEIERGIPFSGRCLAVDQTTPLQTIINVIQLEPPNLIFAQTDQRGIFSIDGFIFYDTAAFFFNTTTKQKIGKMEFIARQPAPIDFEPIPIQLPIQKTDITQRIISQNELMRGTTVLDEIEVKAKKIEDQTIDRVQRPYGKPDYVLKRKDLNLTYGNLLQTLPGKVPGLVVRQAGNAGGLVNGVMTNGNGMEWVVYIAKGGNSSSILNPKEVIITINDVVVTGKPEQILSAIDPQTVESIEVKTGVNVLYGSLGGNGIVSIYTRKDIPDDVLKKSKGLVPTKLTGYATPRKFSHPDYNGSEMDRTSIDYRSTIYWNPEIKTGAKDGSTSVSFFTADLPGTYQIVVEGITQKGQPVRCVYSIEVKEED